MRGKDDPQETLGLMKRIRMSEAGQPVKCANPQVNHARLAGFVATNKATHAEKRPVN
jgi:hypothetical protein